MRRDPAFRQLRQGKDKFESGTCFRSQPLNGWTALIFPTVGRTYSGIGRALRNLAPDLVHPRLRQLTAELDDAEMAGRTWAESQGVSTFMWGNFAARLVRTPLGINIAACMSVSCGEISMMGAPVWADRSRLLHEFVEMKSFTEL